MNIKEFLILRDRLAKDLESELNPVEVEDWVMPYLAKNEAEKIIMATLEAIHGKKST